jgi:hypothetical protein
MTTRRCIFCGVPANSKEHLFAGWVLQSLGGMKRMRQTLSDGIPRELTGPMTIRCLCEHCNNEWLSEIENSAKPIMEPLMHDKGGPLTPADQEIMAIWASKTAMIGEGTKPQNLDRFFSQQERDSLRTDRQIPEGMIVQLGRYYAPAGHHFASTDVTWRVGEVVDALKGNITTMVVGHLVFQTVMVRAQIDSHLSTLQLPIRATANWDALLTDIWPVRHKVEWPPSQSFTGRARDSNFILRLHDRWKVTPEEIASEI